MRPEGEMEEEEEEEETVAGLVEMIKEEVMVRKTLFVCIDRFSQGSRLLHKLPGCKCLAQSLHLPIPCLT